MKEFKTIGDIVTDEIFIKEVATSLRKAKDQRNSRPEPKPGFRYKRDWYDQMDYQQLTSKYFISQIPDIWLKKSHHTSAFRNIIQFVCDRAFHSTLLIYAELDKIKSDREESAPSGSHERDAGKEA